MRIIISTKLLLAYTMNRKKRGLVQKEIKEYYKETRKGNNKFI